MSLTLAALLDLLATRGQAQYGQEAVTQLDHALQCAALAAAEDGRPALIAASLLHDLGHLLHPLGEDAAERGIDDRHEHRAMPWLRPLFGPAVTEPIRLHVAAKRYLCATDPAYWDALSPASQRSLALQGGIYAPDAVVAFIQQPYAAEAAQLRRWDDRAKVPQQPTPDLQHFAPILAGLCRS